MRFVLVFLLILSAIPLHAANSGTFICRWAVDLTKASQSDLDAIDNIGRKNSTNPALNLSLLSPGGTTWMEVRVSTLTPTQNTAALNREASGVLIRLNSWWVGVCPEQGQITGEEVRCVWGEKTYNPLPADWGYDYSIHRSTP